MKEPIGTNMCPIHGDAPARHAFAGCTCGHHSTLESETEKQFSAEAVNMAYENGKRAGRKEMAAELRALLEEGRPEEDK